MHQANTTSSDKLFTPVPPPVVAAPVVVVPVVPLPPAAPAPAPGPAPAGAGGLDIADGVKLRQDRQPVSNS